MIPSIQILLKELEEFAFKGIPDVRGCKVQDAQMLHEAVSTAWFSSQERNIISMYFLQWLDLILSRNRILHLDFT